MSHHTTTGTDSRPGQVSTTFEGKVAVVTGAAGGIGAALVQRLLEHGSQVVAADLHLEPLQRLVDSLESHENRVVGVSRDCTSEDELKSLLAFTEERFGAVDIFAANAGVSVGSGLDTTPQEWALSLEVNVLAHVRAAQLLLPGWLERGSGHFLTTASAAGLLSQIGSATYSVSKHAAVAFAEWLSITYGSRGVKVTCLCPMGVDTEMLRQGHASESSLLRQAARAVAESGSVLPPLVVADEALRAITEDRFFALPHPEVGEFFRRRAADHERWLAGMRRTHDALAG